MTDNTNMSPDDVLAKAKATLAAYEQTEVDIEDYEAVYPVLAMAQHVPPLVAALETALARNRELEAQNARKPIAEFDLRFDSWNGFVFGTALDEIKTLPKQYLGKRVHFVVYEADESEDAR